MCQTRLSERLVQCKLTWTSWYYSQISRPISQNYINNLHINWSGVQVEGEGLLHQLNLCKQITIGQSFILGQPWVKIKILLDKTFILKEEAASQSFLSVMPAIVNI